MWPPLGLKRIKNMCRTCFGWRKSVGQGTNRCGPHNEKYDNLQDGSRKLHSQVRSSKTAPFDKTGGGRAADIENIESRFMERQALHVRPVFLRTDEIP
jgi:hypothetical protein